MDKAGLDPGEVQVTNELAHLFEKFNDMLPKIYKKSPLLFIAASVKGVKVPTLHVGEEVLDGSHAKLVGPQIHNTDLQLQEALLDKLALVIGSIVKHENGVTPPVRLEAVEVLDKPA